MKIFKVVTKYKMTMAGYNCYVLAKDYQECAKIADKICDDSISIKSIEILSDHFYYSTESLTEFLEAQKKRG